MAVYEMEEVAAGTQNAMKLAVAFGAAASHAPGTCAMVTLPAPSRDTAGGAYFDREVAVPSGLYEGVPQLAANAEQLGAEQGVQLEPPSDVATLLFVADHMASWYRGHELMPASEDVP
jgi:hypothetical protein